MEGVEPLEAEKAVSEAPVVDSEVKPLEEVITVEVEERENQKKRKVNPVTEGEALEDAHQGRPVRTKYARYANALSPKSESSPSDVESREDLKAKREEERQKKSEEREAKKAAVEEARRQKEAEKLKKEAEKKAREEAKEAEKQRREEEKLKKEAEKLAKEEERRKAKEAAERDKQLKEDERKRAKEQKEEEKRKKEEEKRLKEEEKQAKVAERQKTVEKAQEAAKRQSNMLMSFVKKTPTNTPNTSLIEEDGDGRKGQYTGGAPRYERVGKFLAWVPPQGALVATIQKWTNRVTLDEFQEAVTLGVEGASDETIRHEFDRWRLGAKARPTQADLAERRKASFQHRSEFQTECSPSIEKQKQHLLANPIKLIQIDESWRPPFYGTFTSTSAALNGRKWLGKASGIDYEIDSEDECFESSSEAEDLEDVSRGSDEEGEVGEANEYEFDDTFLVPDGHLSDEEAVEGEDGEMVPDDEPKHRADRAALLAQTKRRLDNKQQAPLGQLQPILSPLVHTLNRLNPTENADVKSPALLEVFQAHTMHILGTTRPICVDRPATESNANGLTSPNPARKHVTKAIPPEILPQLAAFIHKQYLASFERLLDLVGVEFTQAPKKQFGRFMREKCEKIKTVAGKQGVWLIKRMHRAELGLPLEDPLPPATTPLPFTSPTKENTAKTSSATNTPKKKTTKRATNDTPKISDPSEIPTSLPSHNTLMDVDPSTASS